MNSNEVKLFCMEHGACSQGKKWAEQFTTLADVWDKCERGDWMLWMLRRREGVEHKLLVTLAVTCAEHVLPIFEKLHPKKTAPRVCLATIRRWLDGKATLDEVIEARRAASSYAAAYAAAYAAYAAYAAAYAAYAAYAAAYAAYAAAYAAAAYAAAASSYAAYAAAEKKWQAEEIRKIFGNPWRT